MDLLVQLAFQHCLCLGHGLVMALCANARVVHVSDLGLADCAVASVTSAEWPSAMPVAAITVCVAGDRHGCVCV